MRTSGLIREDERIVEISPIWPRMFRVAIDPLMELHRTWGLHDASTLAQFIEQSLRGTVVCPTRVGRRRICPYRLINDLRGFTQANEQRRFSTDQLLAQPAVATQAYRRIHS